MKPEVLLVDGHSMIFQWPELRELHARRPASARSRLVEICIRHGDALGIQVVVVFDGRGPRAACDPAETRVQIFYSKSGQTADEVIERFVAKYSASCDITVATDDNLERTTVTTFGARWMSSQLLLEEIARSSADLQRRIDTLNKKRR